MQLCSISGILHTEGSDPPQSFLSFTVSTYTETLEVFSPVHLIQYVTYISSCKIGTFVVVFVIIPFIKALLFLRSFTISLCLVIEGTG